MNTPKFSISTKLLVSFTGLAVVVLSIVLFAVSQILDNQIRGDIDSSFQEAGTIFEQLQDVRFRQLRQTATLVAELPYMKAAISTGDRNTVNQQIRSDITRLLRLSPLTMDTTSSVPVSLSPDSVGLIMVFDEQGMNLGQLSEVELSDQTMRQKPGVSQALNGQFPEQSFIWKKGDSYFRVITVPVLLRNRVIAALSLGYPIRNEEAELMAQVIDYEVAYFVDDKLLNTTIPAFSGDEKMTLSQRIMDAGFQVFNAQGDTTVTMKMRDQDWLIYLMPLVEEGAESLGISGYYVVAKSLTQALQPLYRLQKVIFLIGLGGILLAIFLGTTLTNSFTKPINRLLEGIGRIEKDNYDQPVEVQSNDEFGILTDTFNKLIANIKENLEEKENLLGEIHHRVKNNLALISGLLELETFQKDDPAIKRTLQNSLLRIQSMSIVHDMLYEAQNFSKLAFGNFINEMISAIKTQHYSEAREIEIIENVDEFSLNVNQAVPFGLIINELVTNAYKHAYADGESGTIEVSIAEEGDHILLKVKDQGAGLPKDFKIDDVDTPGFMLVKIYSQQIGADLLFDTQGGTVVTLGFTKEDKKGAMSTME